MSCDPIGIRYRETGGTVRRVHVRNIRDAAGNCAGAGIRVESLTGDLAVVSVLESVVENATRVGIAANGVGAKLTAKNNLVLGPVAPKSWAPNGIQVSRGATGSVLNNDVREMTSPNVPGGAGSGIILFCAGNGVKVRQNTVRTSDLGIALADGSHANIGANQIQDSLYTAISLQFIGTFFGDNLGCPDYPSLTEENVVADNDILNSGIGNEGNGIDLAGFDPSLPVYPLRNSILRNTIRNSGGIGIAIYGGEDNRVATNVISGSDLDGAGGFDAFDVTDPTPNVWDGNTCNTAGKEENQPGLCG
jgi:parallel beta-helix repeat protein